MSARKSFLRHWIINLVSFALLVGGGMPLRSQAAEIPTHYLSYEEASRLALQENADLLVVRYQQDSLKFKSRQALAPNNPVFNYTKADVPNLSLGSRPAQASYGVAFTLGFPGKALAQSASIRHQAESMGEQAVAKEIDLLTALSNSYVSFWTNHVFHKFLQEERKRNDDLLKLLEKKFATSQAAKVDLMNQKVVNARTEQDVLANENEFEILGTQFRQLIRRPDDHTLLPLIPNEIIIPEISQTAEELTRIMLANRHSLKAAEYLVDGAGSALHGAYLQPFPDLQLQGGLNIWHQPAAAPNPGVTRDYTMGISISVPIFFPFNELTGIKAARRDLLAAEAQRDSQRIGALADLNSTYTNFKAARRESENMRRLVVPATQANYELILLNYGLGKADYFRLNDARKSRVDAEKDYLSKRQSMAQLFNLLIVQLGCDMTKKEGPHVCQN